uniref:Uncharacterized protein n=1 Tax=Trichuris muris TaxID=70415 RepID=A0A5S6Q7V2_TRIMR
MNKAFPDRGRRHDLGLYRTTRPRGVDPPSAYEARSDCGVLPISLVVEQHLGVSSSRPNVKLAKEGTLKWSRDAWRSRRPNIGILITGKGMGRKASLKSPKQSRSGGPAVVAYPPFHDGWRFSPRANGSRGNEGCPYAQRLSKGDIQLSSSALPAARFATVRLAHRDERHSAGISHFFGATLGRLIIFKISRHFRAFRRCGATLYFSDLRAAELCVAFVGWAKTVRMLWQEERLESVVYARRLLCPLQFAALFAIEGVGKVRHAPSPSLPPFPKCGPRCQHRSLNGCKVVIYVPEYAIVHSLFCCFSFVLLCERARVVDSGSCTGMCTHAYVPLTC